MQSFVIFYRSPLVYLVGTKVRTDISRGPALLGAIGVLIVLARAKCHCRKVQNRSN